MASNDEGGIVKSDIKDGHAALTICNPARRNAVSLVMWKQIAEHVRRADQDTSIHLITLRGHAGTFVSGADISEFAENRGNLDRAKTYEASNSAAFAALRDATTPTLALIEGFCFGGGIGLAAACDLRLAASSATFAVPAAKLGLAYPVDGVRDLVRLIGPGATKKLFFTADPIAADVALRIGFLEDMVESDALDEAANHLITTILSRAPLTQRAAKSAIAAALEPGREEIARQDAEACFASEDYAEGWQAFLDKRKPTFSGR
ncbi:enoyl-CoA hydratase-related protein [Ahrensia marina]|uniref:enoyl-CoA hydratase-related protein n=1 Tax=Ahrensia marina TaxID=1514904 RepID=UPI0035CF8D4A